MLTCKWAEQENPSLGAIGMHYIEILYITSKEGSFILPIYRLACAPAVDRQDPRPLRSRSGTNKVHQEEPDGFFADFAMSLCMMLFKRNRMGKPCAGKWVSTDTNKLE